MIVVFIVVLSLGSRAAAVEAAAPAIKP